MIKGTYYKDLLLLYFKEIINRSHKESKPNILLSIKDPPPYVCLINEINTINNSITVFTLKFLTPKNNYFFRWSKFKSTKNNYDFDQETVVEI